MTDSRAVGAPEADWDPTTLRSRLRAADRGQPRVAARLLIKISDLTGAQPVHFSATDGTTYWCKWVGNPHGNQSLVHEWVVARLGALLGAPVPAGELVEVDWELVEDVRIEGRSVPGGTWFGLQTVPGRETQVIRDVGKDGNRRRFAFYLALWELCLGCDAQFLYDHTADNQVWSIDHGMWFWSEENEWTPGDLKLWQGRPWDAPAWEGPRLLDPSALMDAASKVELLTSADLGEILGDVPVAWGVPDEDLEALGQFIHDRRTYVAGWLRAHAAAQAKGGTL